MFIRFLSLLSLAILSTFFGCKPKSESESKTPTKPDVADKDRPPLRVLLIEQPDALEEIVRLRWASVSEQRLEFQKASIRDLDLKKPAPTDLIIAPTMLIGSFVEQDWIRELPKEVLIRLESNGPGTENRVEFPPHWLNGVKYAKKSFGIPITCTLTLAGFASDIDLSKLTQSKDASNRLSENDIRIEWERLRVESPSSTSTFIEPDIVDQFFMVASSNKQNAYEGSLLFKLVDCSSRISEPWMVDSAAALRNLYASANSEEKTLCSLGWSWSDSSTEWYIPTVANSSDAENFNSNDIILNKAVIDAAKGSAVFLSSRTRQSSKSVFLMNWLFEPSQVEAIQKAWTLNPNVNVPVPAVQNSYVSVSTAAAKSDDIPVLFQIDEGHRYRFELKSALEEIVANPQADVLQILERCRQRMNALTDSIGRDHQQDSLERSLGLRE